VQLRDFFGHAVGHLGIHTESLASDKSFTAQLQQDTFVFGLDSGMIRCHISLQKKRSNLVYPS
jgi:hypothetical protein